MLHEDYITSIVVDNKLVNIGIDDYGQCYYFEYAKDNEIKSIGCGAYNFDYLREILDYFGKEYTQEELDKLYKQIEEEDKDYGEEDNLS